MLPFRLCVVSFRGGLRFEVLHGDFRVVAALWIGEVRVERGVADDFFGDEP
jgi:hypothetical protein